MWKFLLVISIVPVAAALVARWWFGLRVLAAAGDQLCRCNLEKWTPPAVPGALVRRAEAPAAEFAAQLRDEALANWKKEDPKAAMGRESTRRFGLAVPPLAAMIAVMGVIVARIPVLGAFAVLLGATALAAVFGVLTMAGELTAITRAAGRIRESRCFPRRDDEDAVIRCAIALAWKEAFPPVLGILQR